MDKSEAITDWPSYLSKSKSIFEENWFKEKNEKKCLGKITLIQTIAKGGFSTVVLAKMESSLYAVKIMDKDKVEKSENYKHVLDEKRALQAAKFPFIISMDFCFSDSKQLFFVTPYMQGGDLWFRMKKCHLFSEPVSRFYATQVVLALEYLHYMDIIYRDLKPENILINRDGYIKLADLGFCKRIKDRTYTMCGTTQYIAPEILLNKGYAFPADWWSFGVLVFEMGAGRTPFVCIDEFALCNKITSCEYTMKKEFSEQLQALIRNLLTNDPGKRIAVAAVKQHPWFAEVSWLDVLNKRLVPPFVPQISDLALEDPSTRESKSKIL